MLTGCYCHDHVHDAEEDEDTRIVTCSKEIVTRIYESERYFLP